MTLGLRLYRFAMRLAPLLAPMLFKWRAAKGKELPGRYNERMARALPARANGPLVWLHGASLGECKLLLGLAEKLKEQHPDIFLLFTSQTISAAKIIGEHLPEHALHQMLPIDTPATARRFIAHWKPALCVFAESEVWPNLLAAAKAHGSRTALINARMRQSSIERWGKAPQTAVKIFSQFDAILAADQSTARGLSELLGVDIREPGNLKTSLVEPIQEKLPPSELAAWQGHETPRQIVLAASTHESEEAFVLEVFSRLPDTARLIIAPRHPARADDIEALIKATGTNYVRRSLGQDIASETRILLADTFGEMDLWYAGADAVYLGGSLPEEIGGHNPLEPLRFGLPIATGPHNKNFQDIHGDLSARGWIHTVHSADELATFLETSKPASARDIQTYFEASKGALEQTLSALSALIHEGT